MPATKIMTLRIDPELHQRLRDAARAAGRSVSAQVLHLVRRELLEEPVRRQTPLPTMGWLRHLDAPDTLAEFRRLRRSLSRQVIRRVRRHAGK
jgi:hypothetical protein